MSHMKGCDVVVLEDSDKVDTNPTNAEIIIDQESINRRVPACFQALLSEAHKDVVVEDIEDRLRSGNFNADLDGDTPPPMFEFFAGRLAALLEKRRIKLSTEKMVWFTLRTEPNGDVYLNWPISAYMPVSAGGIYHDQKVQRACTRLKGRAHIKGIRVTGSVKPSAIPMYFEWVDTE